MEDKERPAEWEEDKERPAEQEPTAREEEPPSLGVSGFFAAENVDTLVSIISAAVGLTTVTIKGISLWVEERKSRKISLKTKAAEMEISGPVSREKLEEALEIFANFHKERLDEEKVSVVVTEDSLRRLPPAR